MSHPVRGAWIEIVRPLPVLVPRLRRTPSGVRGLKCGLYSAAICSETSHPVRGAWIEILRTPLWRCRELSHPVRGAWIEISSAAFELLPPGRSHPVRGAWIEIVPSNLLPCISIVAPRQGCVD